MVVPRLLTGAVHKPPCHFTIFSWPCLFPVYSLVVLMKPC
jgi:hypothetical protein